jgi:hypothetical protein
LVRFGHGVGEYPCTLTYSLNCFCLAAKHEVTEHLSRSGGHVPAAPTPKLIFDGSLIEIEVEDGLVNPPIIGLLVGNDAINPCRVKAVINNTNDPYDPPASPSLIGKIRFRMPALKVLGQPGGPQPECYPNDVTSQAVRVEYFEYVGHSATIDRRLKFGNNLFLGVWTPGTTKGFFGFTLGSITDGMCTCCYLVGCPILRSSCCQILSWEK